MKPSVSRPVLTDHGAELKCVSEQISQLGAQLEVSDCGSTVGTQPAPETAAWYLNVSTTGDDNSLALGTDDADNVHDVTNERHAAHVRVKGLLSKLHFEQREEVLTKVHKRLNGKVAKANVDMDELDQLGEKQARRCNKVEYSAHDVRTELNKKENSAIDLISDFRRSLSVADRARREAMYKTGLGPARSGITCDTDNMSNAELEGAIKNLEVLVLDREAEAQASLLAMAETDGSTLPMGAEANVTDEMHQKLLYMRETIREIEKRGRLLKEAVDYMSGRYAFGEDGESEPLSHEANVIVEELREEVRQVILPELQASREEEYGDDLVPVDRTQLEKVQNYCEGLAHRIVKAEAATERIRRPGACKEYVDHLVIAVDNGRKSLSRPDIAILDANLESLGVDDEYETDEEDKKNKVPNRRLQSSPAPTSVAPLRHNDVVAATELVRKEIRSCRDGQCRLINCLSEATCELKAMQEDVNIAEKRAKVLQENQQVVQSSIELFMRTLSVLQQEPTPVGGNPCGQESQVCSNSVAAAMATLTASGVSSANADLWADPFLIEGTEQLTADVLASQDGVLAALREERGRLDLECRELGTKYDQRLKELSGACWSDPGGAAEASINDAKTVAANGRAAMKAFLHSCDGIEEFPGEAAALQQPGSFGDLGASQLVIGPRRQAVAAAWNDLQRHVTSSSEDPAKMSQLMELLALQPRIESRLRRLEAAVPGIEALREHRRRHRQAAAKKRDVERKQAVARHYDGGQSQKNDEHLALLGRKEEERRCEEAQSLRRSIRELTACRHAFAARALAHSSRFQKQCV